MSEPTLLAKIREWISGVAFDVFLWSIQMTQDEYFDTIIGDHGLIELEQENKDLHDLVWDLRSENYAMRERLEAAQRTTPPFGGSPRPHRKEMIRQR